MKKLMILTAIMAVALCASGADYVARGVQPSSAVATVTNDFADVAVPVLIYTEITGTTSNVVTLTYEPTTSTNTADYGKAYIVDTFTTTGGSEVPIILNDGADADNGGAVILKRNDVLKLTDTGNTDDTNTYYRILFKVE